MLSMGRHRSTPSTSSSCANNSQLQGTRQPSTCLSTGCPTTPSGAPSPPSRVLSPRAGSSSASVTPCCSAPTNPSTSTGRDGATNSNATICETISRPRPFRPRPRSPPFSSSIPPVAEQSAPVNPPPIYSPVSNSSRPAPISLGAVASQRAGLVEISYVVSDRSHQKPAPGMEPWLSTGGGA